MSDLWFKEGLRFKCTGCGKCCTGEPGYVWVTPEEIQEMADFLDMPLDDFATQYIREISGSYSLKELPPENDCVFLKEGQCSVYGARPRQCRTFPFWKENLESKKAWQECAAKCEGIDHDDAPLIPLSAILSSLD